MKQNANVNVNDDVDVNFNVDVDVVRHLTPKYSPQNYCQHTIYQPKKG